MLAGSALHRQAHLVRCGYTSTRLHGALNLSALAFNPAAKPAAQRSSRCGLQLKMQHRTIMQSVARRQLRILEEEANRSPTEAMRQYHFMEACNRYNQPHLAIRRYESTEFATNEMVVKEYIKALAQAKSLDRLRLTEIVRHVDGADGLAAGAVPAGGALQSSLRGGPEEPVHVQFTETGRSQLWKTIRVVGVVGVLATAASMLMEEKGLPKGLGFTTDVQPVMTSNKKFSDVVGVDEAKNELQEIVQYLRSPKTFTRLGGKLPKGLLLTGPPGTGKTLLARAVAGEAGVPFFYMSGSEFEEVFVGVGARRVRDLFAAAKKRSPCIIFVDEIDAIGSHRNPKEQQAMKMTLNQLLVEMDGFHQNQGVIVIGATNFPEVLDKALVRPGRFDQTVVVPLPDVRGRVQILSLYAKPIPLASAVDLEVIARATPGFSGADVSNLMNIAALKASMDGKMAVEMSDLEHACDKIRMGAERKSQHISPENLKLTAYHEGGHALVALMTEGAMPIHKATVVPRGNALGMVSYLPEKDQLNMSRQQMLAHLDVCMGGRVAEEAIFGKSNVTSGAGSDLQQATNMAHNMVTKYGMSETIGPVYVSEEEMRNMSSATKELIDKEVRGLLEASQDRVRKLLQKNNKELHLLAQGLLKHETLDVNQIKTLLAGKSLDSVPTKSAVGLTSTLRQDSKEAAC